MTRHPSVAGSFYEEDFNKLEQQIKDCFYSDLGPGDLPIKRSEKKIKAVIVPHAGYIYSGPCAAWAYKEIAESKFPDTYILIGPNHQGKGSSISIEDWKTPFGLVKNDKDLTREISEKTNIPINESYHFNEHSIEVQLPFLQFASKDNLKNLKIIPITVSHDIKITEFANQINKIIKAHEVKLQGTEVQEESSSSEHRREISSFDKISSCDSKKEVVFIISSDFTHYGRSYGYIPFEEDPQSKIKAMDLKAIKAIKNNDLKGFLDHLEETQSTICGQVPIIILMQTLKDYTAKLEMYYSSTQISNDLKNSVSYASITFK